MNALNNHHHRARLPQFYAITPPDLRPEHINALMAAWRAHDIKQAQCRLGVNHGWQTADIVNLLDKTPNITWFLNSGHIAEPWAERFTRLHLKAAHLISPTPAITRAIRSATSIAASVHNLAEWQAVKPYNPTLITLSPILPTQSHIAAPPLGWANMAKLIARIHDDGDPTTPSLITRPAIFALGGLSPHDLTTARTHGADGIAGIRLFAH